MAVIGVDLGGSKLALGVFAASGELLQRESAPLEQRGGAEVGVLLSDCVAELLDRASAAGSSVGAIGVAVPGIYYAESGRVWAPNIPGWEAYPLREELQAAVGTRAKVSVDSDRACYVLGDVWQGTAMGSRNAIFLAVGTGIGAGILIDGRVLRGQRDIAGAAGWLALDRPHRAEFARYGCLEAGASGPGIVRVARAVLAGSPDHAGPLGSKEPGSLTTADVFAAEAEGDPLARRVIDNAVELWGMAVANLVSLFDPDIVVFGGGVFGPAADYLERIRAEALRWAQPISMPQVRLAVSSLGSDAGLYGAGHLALRSLHPH
jgi:glucokinase